jgi:hypothetical protein
MSAIVPPAAPLHALRQQRGAPFPNGPPDPWRATKSANPLVWKNAAWCTGSAPTWSGKWYVFLVDASHNKTPKVTWTLTCKA